MHTVSPPAGMAFQIRYHSVHKSSVVVQLRWCTSALFTEGLDYRRGSTEFGRNDTHSFNPFTDWRDCQRHTEKHDAHRRFLWRCWTEIHQNPERLWLAWLLRSWGQGAAKKLCAELMQGVRCSCGKFHWRSILLWVDSELGAQPKPTLPARSHSSQ